MTQPLEHESGSECGDHQRPLELQKVIIDIAALILIQTGRPPSRIGSAADPYDDSTSAGRRLFESPAFSAGRQVTSHAFEPTPAPSYSGAPSVHTSVTSTSSV